MFYTWLEPFAPWPTVFSKLLTISKQRKQNAKIAFEKYNWFNNVLYFICKPIKTQYYFIYYNGIDFILTQKDVLFENYAREKKTRNK
jgi:hypothetical protein